MITITIQLEMDFNNDLIIDAESWNYFSREIWVNYWKGNAILAIVNELKEASNKH